MAEVELKTIGATIKEAGEDGSFEAEISTLGVIDHDGDIVERGAFRGHQVAVLPAHQSQHVPLGKAQVHEVGDKAVARGRFNLEIPAAADWHRALRFDLENPPAIQEWSYGFKVMGPEGARADQVDGRHVRRLLAIDEREVSPVLRGASIGTRTLHVKSQKATDRHQAETSDEAWRPWDQVGHLADELPLELARQAYGWIDEEKLEEDLVPKSAGRFLHHFVDDAGELGAASTRACLEGIAVLNGARGGSTIAGDVREKLYGHLAGHLEDAGVEAPELKAETELGGLQLKTELELVTWDLELLTGRVTEILEGRRSNGGDLGKEAKALSLELGAQGLELETVLKELRLVAEGLLPEERAARAAARFMAAASLRLGVVSE